MAMPLNLVYIYIYIRSFHKHQVWSHSDVTLVVWNVLAYFGWRRVESRTPDCLDQLCLFVGRRRCFRAAGERCHLTSPEEGSWPSSVLAWVRWRWSGHSWMLFLLSAGDFFRVSWAFKLHRRCNNKEFWSESLSWVGCYGAPNKYRLGFLHSLHESILVTKYKNKISFFWLTWLQYFTI